MGEVVQRVDDTVDALGAVRARRRRAWALAAIALVSAATAIAPTAARDAPAALPTVSLQQLPAEARALLTAIAEGGPFPYQRDGVVFGNREGLLPERARGYYHEYTVATPGLHTRGARRIICAGAKRSVDECYYSDDHYRSFRRILR
jgi:ribonuclease T1